VWRRKYVIGLHFDDGDRYLEVEHDDMFEMTEVTEKLAEAKGVKSWAVTSLFPENTYDEVVAKMKKEREANG
jgi:hypothetical protein